MGLITISKVRIIQPTPLWSEPCMRPMSFQPRSLMAVSKHTDTVGVLMLCSSVLAGSCRRTHQSLQRYEKTENHMLVCTDCPQPPLIRSSRSQEHCARKCKKVKKNFNCRWVTLSFSVSEALWPHSFYFSPVWTQYLYIFVVYHLVIYFLCAPCRAFNFQRHNRKCHLLPFDRFTHGVKKEANVNFTLYEKKGECCHFSLCFFFFMRTFRCREGFTWADCLPVIAGCAKGLWVSLLTQ